jgi:hypothetical protein
MTAAIEVIVFAVAAGFALIVVATIVVIIGIRQEERRKTIIRGYRPPTACALVARWVLGAHFYLIPEERPGQEELAEAPPWFDRPGGSRANWRRDGRELRGPETD